MCCRGGQLTGSHQITNGHLPFRPPPAGPRDPLRGAFCRSEPRRAVLLRDRRHPARASGIPLVLLELDLSPGFAWPRSSSTVGGERTRMAACPPSRSTLPTLVTAAYCVVYELGTWSLWLLPMSCCGRDPNAHDAVFGVGELRQAPVNWEIFRLHLGIVRGSSNPST